MRDEWAVEEKSTVSVDDRIGEFDGCPHMTRLVKVNSASFQSVYIIAITLNCVHLSCRCRHQRLYSFRYALLYLHLPLLT